MQFAVQLPAELLPGRSAKEVTANGIKALCTRTSTRPHRCSVSSHHRGDVIGVGDVGPYRDGLAARRGDGADHVVGLLGAGPVVDDNPKPPLGEHRCGRRTDSRLAPVITATRLVVTGRCSPSRRRRVARSG